MSVVPHLTSTDLPVQLDHRILSCAYTVASGHPDMKTILVTKDINMRMKARALGIAVEDYITDKVKNGPAACATA